MLAMRVVFLVPVEKSFVCLCCAPLRTIDPTCRMQVILKGGKRIPYGLCFWAGGTQPRPLTKRFIENIGSEQTKAEGSKRGQITVDG